MDVSLFITPLILAILALVIRTGKASFLIAGYNTLPKQEKEQYDKKALCKFISNLLFILAVILLLIAIAKVLNFPYFAQIMVIGNILFFLVTITAVIYANTGDRFKKQS